MTMTYDGTNGITFPDSSQQKTAATGFGFKNRIINGAMGIWQRGTSVTPSLGSLTSYVVDRWASYQTGAATAVYKSTGFNGQPNCAGFNGVASNTSVVLFQPIESVNCSDLVGATVTLSVWLYSTITSKGVSLYIDTANSVDNFSATTQRATSTVSVPSGLWTQYTLTYTNADATVANGIRVRIDFGACTSGTYAFTGVQLEKGSTATSFDYRPYGTELALCQRYYEKSYTQSVAPGTANSTNGSTRIYVSGTTSCVGGVSVAFAVVKRVEPTFTIYSPMSGAAGYGYSYSTSGDRPAASGVGASSAFVFDNGSSVAGICNELFHWTANAEL